MKKLMIALLLLVSGTAYAHHHHGRHLHHGHWKHVNGGWHWVAPMVVGGVITYEITRRPIIIQRPVMVEPPVVVETQKCSPWTEVKNEDGTVTVTRTCQAQ